MSDLIAKLLIKAQELQLRGETDLAKRCVSEAKRLQDQLEEVKKEKGDGK